jgi:hypothetical protein
MLADKMLNHACLIMLTTSLLMSSVSSMSMYHFQIKSCETAAAINPSCLRLFHPAFPDELLNPLSMDDVKCICQAKDMLRIHNDLDHRIYINRIKEDELLPWMIFPSLGLAETKKTFSSDSLLETFESVRPYGYIVWAHLLRKPEKGAVLINNWKQETIVLSDYEPTKGASGYHLDLDNVYSPTKKLHWPALTLEQEILEKKWQPVRVSNNIISGEILQYLPPRMPKAIWELILLLLLSPDQHKDELDALVDTGLSPLKGLISYIRLLKQIRARSETWKGVPSYLQISEYDVYL